MSLPYFQDTFVGTNGTNLTSHAPQFPLPGTTDWTAGSNALVIESNAAATVSAAAGLYYFNIGPWPTFQLDFDYTLKNATSIITVGVNADDALSSQGIVVTLEATAGDSLVKIFTSGGTYYCYFDPPLDTASHHVTMTFDSVRARLYIDTVKKAELLLSGALPSGGYVVINLTSATSNYQSLLQNLRVTALVQQVQSGQQWPGTYLG
jgi:hypothetical protein